MQHESVFWEPRAQGEHERKGRDMLPCRAKRFPAAFNFERRKSILQEPRHEQSFNTASDLTCCGLHGCPEEKKRWETEE